MISKIFITTLLCFLHTTIPYLMGVVLSIVDDVAHMRKRWTDLFQSSRFYYIISNILCYTMMFFTSITFMTIFYDAPFSDNNIWAIIKHLMIYDLLMNIMHRDILHKIPYFKKLHGVHHSKTIHNMIAADLFYIHIGDAMLEFYIPLTIAIMISNLDINIFLTMLSFSIFSNTIAHSNSPTLLKLNHYKHHNPSLPEKEKHISYSLGLFVDFIRGTGEDSFLRTCFQFGSLVVILYLSRWFYNGVIILGLTAYLLLIVKIILFEIVSTIPFIEKIFWKLFYNLFAKLSQRDPEINDKKILEIGCGQGNGLNVLKNKFPKNNFIGVDLSPENINIGKTRYPDVEFSVDDAENVKSVDDKSIDMVLNVESSHCYPHIDKFYSEVKRVLKSDGSFFYTDFATPEIWTIRKKFLEDIGFKTILEVNITQNVLKSLRYFDAEVESHLKRYPLTGYIPFFRELVKKFTGGVDSITYTRLKTGEYEYRRFVCKLN